MAKDLKKIELDENTARIKEVGGKIKRGIFTLPFVDLYNITPIP